MEYNRSQLKQSVKQAIRQTRPRPVWMTLLYLVITAVGAAVIQQLLSGLNLGGYLAGYYLEMVLQGAQVETAARYVLERLLENGGQLVALILLGSLVVSLVVYLWQSLMTVGFKGYCLEVARGKNPQIPSLFQAFPRAGSVLLTRILTGIFTFLWTLLFTLALLVVMVLAGGLATVVPLLGMLLLLVGLLAYLVAVIWVPLRYAMADYILLDQGVSGMAAVRRSKEMMQGNTGRLFVLYLSFIGWYLVMAAIVLVSLLVMSLVIGGVAMVASGGRNPLGGLYTILATFWLGLLVIVVGLTVINLWLQPYITGSVARFYDFHRSGQMGGETSGGWSGGGWQSGQSGWHGTQDSQYRYTPTDSQGESGAGDGKPAGDSDSGNRQDSHGGDDPWDRT